MIYSSREAVFFNSNPHFVLFVQYKGQTSDIIPQHCRTLHNATARSVGVDSFSNYSPDIYYLNQEFLMQGKSQVYFTV